MQDVCSKKAYTEALDNGYIGAQQAQVLKIFVDSPKFWFTASQISQALGPHGYSETIRNRITELVAMGYLSKVGKVYCPVAKIAGKKRLVNSFQYTGRMKPFEKTIQSVCCPRCKGSGKLDMVVYNNDAAQVDLFR